MQKLITVPEKYFFKIGLVISNLLYYICIHFSEYIKQGEVGEWLKPAVC